MAKWLTGAMIACLWVGTVEAQQATPAGVWLTKGGRSHISIYPCGDNYCGSIVKLAEPYNADGSPKVDENNPEASLRNRPLIGMRILLDMAPGAKAGKWEGSIYNPEDGDVYDGSIVVKGADLEVEGCVAFIICRSQRWTRVQ